MPPKKVAATTPAVASTRPSRKRAAEPAEEAASKRPKRAAAAPVAPTPAAKKPPTRTAAAVSKAKTTAAIKKAPAAPAKKATTTTSSKKAAVAPKKAPATKKKTTTVTKRSTKKVEETEDEESEEEAPKLRKPRVPKVKPPPLNSLPTPTVAAQPLHVFVWGNGDAGQFGLGVDEMNEIGRPKLHAWVEDAIANGTLGGEGVGVESIVAGGMHSLAVTTSGKMWSWGVNDEGALGRKVVDVPDPADKNNVLDREELEANPYPVESLTEDKFRPVVASAGDNVSIAIGQDGVVKAWGSFHSNQGAMGFSSSAVQSVPVALPFLSGITFSAVETGANHVVGLATDGKVYAWGAGEQGQLGRKILARRMLNGTRPDSLHLREAVVIGTGSFHSFAVLRNGEVYAWGLNQYGQLGLENPIPKSGERDTIFWVPTLIDELTPDALGGARVVQISGGEHHTLFLLDDGRVFGAGRVDSSQLGLAQDHPAMKEAKEEERDYIAIPVYIPFPPPPTTNDQTPELPAYVEGAAVTNPIAKISVGGRSSLAVSRTGHIYSFGYGASCQLGLGADQEEQETPGRIRWKGSNDWTVVDASAGGQHCFLLATKNDEVPAPVVAPVQENGNEAVNGNAAINGNEAH